MIAGARVNLRMATHPVLDGKRQDLEFNVLGVEVGGMSAVLYVHSCLWPGDDDRQQHTVFSSTCGLLAVSLSCSLGGRVG